jgi:hypothetical protein
MAIESVPRLLGGDVRDPAGRGFGSGGTAGTMSQSTTIRVGAMSAAQMSALRSGMQIALVWPFPLLLIGAVSTRVGAQRNASFTPLTTPASLAA